MSDSKVDLQIERFRDALQGEGSELGEALARWRDYSPVVCQDGRWLLDGFITYFRGINEMLAAIDPDVPVGLPAQCMDPVQIARFFGLPPGAFNRLPGHTVPRWLPSAGRHGELHHGPYLIRRYGKEPTSQGSVLEAFEQAGWVEVLENPLLDADSLESTNSKLLSDTIYQLNRNHITPGRIRFHLCRSGTAVAWEQVI
jgi:hypothetical protein